MEEENITQEVKEKLEEIGEHAGSWNRYLAITTALIAVCAALASLQSGSYSNEAILQKNNAILYQNKASDQWNYYQAKGIKKNVAESFYQQTNDEKLKKEIDRYSKEQQDIQKQAITYQTQVQEANDKSEKLFEKHHKMALSVAFFQISIALSAMSALLRRKSFWFFSIGLTIVGLWFFRLGLF